MDFEGSFVISYLDNKGRSNTFSNILELNQKFEQDWEAGVPTITVEKTKDANNKLTNIKLKVDLAGVDPSTVSKVQVLSSFSYELRENLNLDMIGLLNAEVESFSGIGKATLTGSLVFKQDEPILIDNVRRVLYNTDPLAEDFGSTSLPLLLEKYQQRKGKLSVWVTFLQRDLILCISRWCSPRRANTKRAS